MEQKLDVFRPSPEVLMAVKRQIMNAGVDPDSIPMEWLDVMIAAMTKWITQTQDGTKYAVNWLQFQWKAGMDDHEYDYVVPGGAVMRIPANKVHFFMGAAISGNAVNPAHLVITKKESFQCEGCGIGAHCVKDAHNPERRNSERLCNTCLYMSDNIHLKRQGDPVICRECSKSDCSHHPSCQRMLG
jgi:hypothetical protein